MSGSNNCRFTLSENDAVVAYRLATNHQGLSTVVMFTVALAVAIAWRVILGGPWVFILPYVNRFIIIYLGALITGWIQVTIDRVIFLPRRARRIYRQENWRAERHLFWGNEGFLIKDSHGEWTIAWSDFIKRKEDRKMLLLYRSDARFFIVPKRHLYEEQITALTSFTNLIRQC